MKITNIENTLNNQTVKQSFGTNPKPIGLMERIGKRIINSNKFKGKLVDPFEYDQFSMSVPAMMLLLYGATVPPRYINAVDKHDRREILTRDVTSITAILFFAKALSRGFSKGFSKLSGFALNNTPKNHGENIFKRIADYLNPTSTGGIDVLTSQELTLKYSNLKNYQNGIHDFIKFIKEQGGNVQKVLGFDPTVKENTEKILGKDLFKSTFEEIDEGFKKAKGTEALENIYKIFQDPKNSYVKKAKTMNSFFGFLSVVLLVPAFMIWIERFNERTTQKLIAKEKAEKAAKLNSQADIQETPKTEQTSAPEETNLIKQYKKA